MFDSQSLNLDSSMDTNFQYERNIGINMAKLWKSLRHKYPKNMEPNLHLMRGGELQI